MSLLGDLGQFGLLSVVAIAAWFGVVDPAVAEVRRVSRARDLAMQSFESIARRVERSRGLIGEASDEEYASLALAVNGLREAWRDANVSPRLLPALERRAAGPMLVLVDTGPGGARRDP